MILSMNEQFYLFFAAVAMGITGGFVYGLIRIFRLYIAHNIVGIYIEDILFWLLFSVFVFLTMLCLNYAEIRPYIYMGILIGFAIYRLAIHKWIVKLLNPIITLMRLFAEIILTPIMVLIYPFKKISAYLFNKIKRKQK